MGKTDSKVQRKGWLSSPAGEKEYEQSSCGDGRQAGYDNGDTRI